MAETFQVEIEGAVHSLAEGITIIGRGSDADITVPSRQVSSAHCRLTLTAGRLTIEDLGSTNGTFVNGERLASGRKLIGPSDSVTLGKTGLRVIASVPAPDRTSGAPLAARRRGRSPAQQVKQYVTNGIILAVIVIVALIGYKKLTAPDPRIAPAEQALAAAAAFTDSAVPDVCITEAQCAELDGLTGEHLAACRQIADDLPVIAAPKKAMLERLSALHEALEQRAAFIRSYEENLNAACGIQAVRERAGRLQQYLAMNPPEPYLGRAQTALVTAEEACRAEVTAAAEAAAAQAQSAISSRRFGEGLAVLAAFREAHAADAYFTAGAVLDRARSAVEAAAAEAYNGLKEEADHDVRRFAFHEAQDRFKPVFEHFGVAEYRRMAQDEIGRIRDAARQQEEAERARVAVELEAARVKMRLRAYDEALADYERLLPKITLPTVREEIEDAMALLAETARLKTAVIDFINRSRPLRLADFDPAAEGTEFISAADQKTYSLSDTTQPEFVIPFPWEKMPWGVLLLLAQKAVEGEPSGAAAIAALEITENRTPGDLAGLAANTGGRLGAIFARCLQRIDTEQAALVYARLQREERDARRRMLAHKLAGEYAATAAYLEHKEEIDGILAAEPEKPAAAAQGPVAELHAVPQEHPRLFGSIDRLKQLAQERSAAYGRMMAVARASKGNLHTDIFSMALTSALTDDKAMGRKAIDRIQRLINGPIRVGHETFGTDLANCAVVYDMCHPYWTDDERNRFFAYMNKTVDANVNSEKSPLANGYYGYKNWGIGLACYATYYENDKAPGYLKTLHEDYKKRAAPSLDMGGEGGSWAEGHYCHYFMYYWLVYCEAARFCEGIDYYAMAPKYYTERAAASMFEQYPGVDSYRARRPIPRGDGGGRVFGGHTWNVLAARRMLVNYYADDPVHQVLHAYNEQYPDIVGGDYDYQDFLWYDRGIPRGDLNSFKLSHFSPGAGIVFARSSWKEDATYFMFRCGDRYTSHQHLDVGHFLVYKYDELAGDGGHYDGFGTSHDVNYHLRTIAHSTMLVEMPSEQWPKIRSGPCESNDGGQHHNFGHPNGYAMDAAEAAGRKTQFDIADMLAFDDKGAYVYMAGDCSRAYLRNKVEFFTRQIVYLRPDTIVMFDRVKSKRADYKKKWVLQALDVPTGKAPNLIVTNGRGRLFVQTLLPENPEVSLASGANLYRIGDKVYNPSQDTGPAPKCRIEISPSRPAETDIFLHVLTAASAGTQSVPRPAVEVRGPQVMVGVLNAKITFNINTVGGTIEIGGTRTDLANTINRN